MPLYEYKCGQCSHHVEKLQRLNAEAPQCCDTAMTKQISRSSFSLKGEGWYKDHYGLKPPTTNSQD